jgi:predicted PurR-regulated permease PerM
MTLTKVAALFLIIISIFVVLILGKSLIIPFVIAVLIWYLINALGHWISRFRFKKIKIPYWVSTAVAALIITIIILFVGSLIAQNARQMIIELPKYEKNTVHLADKIGKTFPIVEETVNKIISSENTGEFWENISPLVGDVNISQLITNLLNTLSGMAGNTFLILIYVLFLFFEQAAFPKKIRALFSQRERLDQFHQIIEDINESIRAYFKVKLTVSFVTAFASYLLMAFIGLDFAIFWAFLIFLLNFIPNIGSLIATIFPALLSLIQFDDSFTPFLTILIGVGAIQLIVGNYLEPRMMGSSLNISSLVVILALTLWGAMWGVAGMILCVPITVILMIILAQFPSTRAVAILLSENGELLHELEEIHESIMND